MPKQKDIRSLLQKQIANLTEKLTNSRASATYYNSVVSEQQEELEKLNNALASLDGVLPPKWEDLPATHRSPLLTTPGKNTTLFTPNTVCDDIKIVTLNGEPIVLEPGFHIEKNSFGEESIVPDGVMHAPAAEPAATPDTNARLGTGMVPLPAITSGEQFDDPADIISGELPNG